MHGCALWEVEASARLKDVIERLKCTRGKAPEVCKRARVDSVSLAVGGGGS